MDIQQNHPTKICGYPTKVTGGAHNLYILLSNQNLSISNRSFWISNQNLRRNYQPTFLVENILTLPKSLLLLLLQHLHYWVTKSARIFVHSSVPGTPVLWLNMLQKSDCLNMCQGQFWGLSNADVECIWHLWTFWKYLTFLNILNVFGIYEHFEVFHIYEHFENISHLWTF